MPYLFSILSFWLGLMSSPPALEAQSLGEGRLDRRAGIEFVDVGQGSAALLFTRSGEVVALDAGPSSGAEALAFALSRRGHRHIDLWVLSHFDADHIGGFGRVWAGADGIWQSDDDLDLARTWDRGSASLPDSDALALYFTLARDIRAGVAVGEHASFDHLDIEIMPGASQAPKTENARGLALCIDFEGVRIFAPGDLSAADSRAAAQRCGPVDIWWVNHHGAPDGVDPDLVEILEPRLSVISAARENSHCHPAGRSLALLHERAVVLLGVAGLGPDGACPGLSSSFSSLHRLQAGSLWLPLGPKLEGPRANCSALGSPC